jgi:hypothetical protein
MHFDQGQSFRFLCLAIVAPALFAIGYWVAARLVNNQALPAKSDSDSEIPTLYLQSIFYGLALVAAYQLQKSGMFARLGSWLDYGQWILQRMLLLSKVGYWGFVNMYTWVPLAAAAIVISPRRTGKFWRYLPVAITLCLAAAMFFKKTVVTAGILILLAYILRCYFTRRISDKGLSRALLIGLGLVATFYFAAVVVPSYRTTSTTAEAVLSGTKVSSVVVPANNVLGISRTVDVAVYSILAPLTRTSVPAMYYTAVFPEKHAFYGLDFGQDILGFGGMPDDNRFVWSVMNPAMPDGTVTVPFQFAFYSQVGLFPTLILCALCGLVVGAAWMRILQISNISVRCLSATLLTFLCMHLAIDSLRQVIVSSYGMLWGAAFIAMLSGIHRYFGMRTSRTSKIPTSGFFKK